MLHGRCVVACSFLAGWSAVAFADIAPLPDPEIAIDIGSQSDPINVNTQFQTVNGGGTFGYFNPTNGFITELAFQVQVNPGTFNCSNPGGYFLNCSAIYDTDNGLLTITFFGTNPQEPGEPPEETEQGEGEGIPPLLAGCAPPNQDLPGCNQVGHFTISLNDPNLTTGSWNLVNPNPDAPLQFTTTSVEANGVDVTPEPSTMLPLAGACLLIAIFARRRLLHRTTAP
jgi:hypothetical protein